MCCTLSHSAGAVAEWGSVQGPSPLTVIVACGPFAVGDGSDYAPLRDLASVVRDARADVLLLVGPVASADSAVLKGEGPQQSPETLLTKHVVPVLKDLLRMPYVVFRSCLSLTVS